MSYEVCNLQQLTHSPENFPTIIVNENAATTLDEAVAWIGENVETLKTELLATGALLFRGFPVTNADEYDRFFAGFGYGNFTYKESLSNAVRINHTDVVFTANEAPKDVEIYLHNEMAQTPLFPSVISLFCQSAAEQGGATVVCRSDRIYQEIARQEPELTQKLEDLGIRYTTRMPAEDARESGQGRSWRGTLSVITIEEAEAKLQELGYSWRWEPDGALLAQTAPLSAIRVLDDGRRSFFNQILAAYLGWEGARDDPSSALCFGDDSPIPKTYMESLVAIAQSLSYDIDWQDQDVAVVSNHLAMHGRRPYSGERKRVVLVALGR